MTRSIRLLAARGLLSLVVFAAPFMMMWGQEMNRKFSLTTQIFLEELQQKQQQASGKRRAPAKAQEETERLVASPDTIGGVAYISCFVHLNDPSNLSEVQALGVRVQESFGNLDFVTANVPVDKLEALADVDNVTKIEVAQLMHISSDVARQKTNVDDLLKLSADATNRGIHNKYDGTGVVLGIVDTGIDFQHIAFKDKDGNSRIKRAYLYDGSGEGAEYSTPEAIAGLTTDDNTQDHGTHCASTAGGSSVIVNKIADDNFTITVTDDHANATYGGMAPGADLYLAGIKGLIDTELTNAIKKIVDYADSEGKPVVVSNSWGGDEGARDGKGTLHSFVSEYFGDSHRNHIILFASANNAGKASEAEGGGYFVSKKNTTQADPLYTIVRTSNSGGDLYEGFLSFAYSDKPMQCAFYVLNTKTNEIMAGLLVKENSSFTNLSVNGTPLYTGTLRFNFNDSGTNITIYSNELTSAKTGTYSLAFAFEPTNAEATANIYSFACKNHYYTGFLPVEGITWTNGTDDVSVSDEATIPDAISIGAYMSKKSWTVYNGGKPTYIKANDEDDIAAFSSYATAEQSPTGLAYPWITAPGAMVAAGVNHYHTGDGSYYAKEMQLLVNNPDNPYGVMQGTSMATPVAAGIVALWLQAAKSVGKTLTVNQVKDIMARTAVNDSYTTGSNASHFGKGKIDALAGIHYIVDGTIDLIDNAYNNTMISRNTGKETSVMLYGRTLWKDGKWNTLCLPFSMTAEQVTSQLAPAELKTLSTSSFANNKLTLNFESATTIEAGKPYIIKWNAAAQNLVNPRFTGVTISSATANVENTYIDFIGCTSPVSFTANDRSKLFLGTNDNLYYPSADMTVNSCRGYFQLKGIEAGDKAGVKEFRLNFDGEDDEVDEVNEVIASLEVLPSGQAQAENDDSWYSLDGRKLGGRPTQGGFYIHNGRKVLQ